MNEVVIDKAGLEEKKRFRWMDLAVRHTLIDSCDQGKTIKFPAALWGLQMVEFLLGREMP